MAAKGNRHAWSTRLENGEKREVRATHFGGKWKFQSTLTSDEEWSDLEVPTIEDLETLYRMLHGKYKRKHMSWNILEGVENLLNDRGVTVEDF